MENIRKDIEAAHGYLAGEIHEPLDTAIVLGTGLGGLVEDMEIQRTIPYEKIPHFPLSTVPGHTGCLIIGQCAGKDVLVMQGRVHFYEGYAPAKITFPIRVMQKLGIRTLIISNAAGGLNPLFKAGDVMVISDHINLTGQNPLLGPNLDEFGPRFPDMSCAYDPRLIELAEMAALEEKIRLHKGIYVGVIGPSLETPAETRLLRMIGADAVGMSTIPEVIVAVHGGMKILGFSAISNINLPDCMERASIDEILKNASVAGRKMIRLIKRVLQKI